MAEKQTGQKAIFAVNMITRIFLLVVVPASALLIGLHYYATGGQNVTTENAYVKADIIVVSADVAGRVIEVAVRDDQPVNKGDHLFRLDPSTHLIKRERAKAKMDVVRTEVQSLRADYRSAVLEQKEGRQRVAFLKRQVDRLVSLKERGMVRADVFDASTHDLEVGRMKLSAVEERINRVLASLNGDPGLPAEQHPKYIEAKAAFDEAEISIADTYIKSPANGIVSNMKLQPGEHVTKGGAVFSIVAIDPMWIEANYKETQLTFMRVGQRAEVIADAYPDVVWDGIIEAIAPATGAEFALLPPQNATGNWVKVVQRVPVKIYVDRNSHDLPLRVGMTVTVSVQTGKARGLPSMLRGLENLSWFPKYFSESSAYAQKTR